MPPELAVPLQHITPAVRSAGYPTNKSLLFESNFTTKMVNIYLTKVLSKNPSPITSFAEVSGGCPYDMAFDKKKTLYLVDSCLSQIEEYPKGSTTLKTTITDGILFPLGIAIDKKQTLYVSCSDPAQIQEYANGSTSPTKTVSGGGMSEPFGLSFDSKGNLYIADFGAAAVFELPAGGSSVTNLNLQGLDEPLGTAVDQKTRLLWVTDGSGNKINVYKIGGSTSPLESIAGNGFPYSVSIQNHGKPRGTAVEGDGSSDSVYAFHSGSYTPYATLTNQTGNPAGVLISEP
jgi:hypothetical protein